MRPRVPGRQEKKENRLQGCDGPPGAEKLLGEAAAQDAQGRPWQRCAPMQSRGGMCLLQGGPQQCQLLPTAPEPVWAHPREIGAQKTQGHCGSWKAGQWGSMLPFPWGEEDNPCARADGRHRQSPLVLHMGACQVCGGEAAS